MTDLKELQKTVFEVIKEHGFYDKWNHNKEILYNANINIDDFLAQPKLIDLAQFDLMHSEISEASEEIRNNNTEKAVIELAGLVIRVLCYCENECYDLEKYILSENERNKLRPKFHGRKVI
jgi:hypothetical protein